MIEDIDPAAYEHAEMATLLLSGDELKDAFLKFYCEKNEIKTVYDFGSSEALKNYVKMCILDDCGCPFNTILCYQDIENLGEDLFFKAFNIVEIDK